MWFSSFNLKATRVKKTQKLNKKPNPNLFHPNPTVRSLWSLDFGDNAQWVPKLSHWPQRLPRPLQGTGGEADAAVAIICLLHLTDTGRNRKTDSWRRPRGYWEGCVSAQVFPQVLWSPVKFLLSPRGPRLWNVLRLRSVPFACTALNYDLALIPT